VLGMYPGDPGDPGGDCSGVVVGGAGHAPGTPVFGLAVGSLGTCVHCSPLTMVPMPPGCVSFEEAATMPTVFSTVHMVLSSATALAAGEAVFLPAAAGGVGLAALQLARAHGAKLVATAGSPSKRALLRGLGVSDVAGSRSTAFVEELAATNSGGVHVVLNTLTSPGMVSAAASLLRVGGRFVEIGKRDVTSTVRVAQERPDVSYGFVALDFLPDHRLQAAMQQVAKGVAAGILRPLPLAAHGLTSVAAALRQLSQARHVGKVVVSSCPHLSSSSSTASSSPINPHGRVAISGGLGSLGLLIAQWLAQQGVQHILLLARSARTTSAASQHLSQLWQGQAQAVVTACDAGCTEDVTAALAPPSHIHHTPPPLSAVLHAGGVLADATLRNQSLAGLRKVMGAKVSGLPHLLGSAQLQPGAHHVLFSSVASLLGSPGQANYSAANAALDAAASAWQHTGQPTVSVQWGAWAGGGMAANDASTAARVARLGMSLIQPQQGLQALGGALTTAGAGSSPVLAAVPFIWHTFIARASKTAAPSASAPTTAAPSFFVEFEQEAQQTPLQAPPQQQQQQQLPRPASTQASRSRNTDIADMSAIVREVTQGVLGSNVGPEEPLMSAGLDSLGAVELRNSLESRLAMALPSTLIFDYPTISAISNFVSSHADANLTAEDGSALPLAPPPSAPLPGPATPAFQAPHMLVTAMACRGPGAPAASAAQLKPGWPAFPLCGWCWRTNQGQHTARGRRHILHPLQKV